MDQHKRFGTGKTNLLLQYDKRRFDGGTERELIQTIEFGQVQQAALDSDVLNSFSQEWQAKWNESAPAASQEKVEEAKAAPEAQEAASKKSSRAKAIVGSLILGPAELCIGLVGIPTCVLALLTFKHFNNKPMIKHSQAILKDCLKSIKKGCWDTLIAPVKIAKLALQK